LEEEALSLEIFAEANPFELDEKLGAMFFAEEKPLAEENPLLLIPKPFENPLSIYYYYYLDLISSSFFISSSSSSMASN